MPLTTYTSHATKMVDLISSEVQLLEFYHAETLKEEPLSSELSILKYSLKESFSGSREAMNYLCEYGREILKDMYIRVAAMYPSLYDENQEKSDNAFRQIQLSVYPVSIHVPSKM